MSSLELVKHFPFPELNRAVTPCLFKACNNVPGVYCLIILIVVMYLTNTTYTLVGKKDEKGNTQACHLSYGDMVDMTRTFSSTTFRHVFSTFFPVHLLGYNGEHWSARKRRKYMKMKKLREKEERLRRKKEKHAQGEMKNH